MTATQILLFLRLEPFDMEIHAEEQKHDRFHNFAIIPNFLPDGNRNPHWLRARYCVTVRDGDFQVVEIPMLQ